jgi:hypothetical protein
VFCLAIPRIIISAIHAVLVGFLCVVLERAVSVLTRQRVWVVVQSREGTAFCCVFAYEFAVIVKASDLFLGRRSSPVGRLENIDMSNTSEVDLLHASMGEKRISDHNQGREKARHGKALYRLNQNGTMRVKRAVLQARSLCPAFPVTRLASNLPLTPTCNKAAAIWQFILLPRSSHQPSVGSPLFPARTY